MTCVEEMRYILEEITNLDYNLTCDDGEMCIEKLDEVSVLTDRALDKLIEIETAIDEVIRNLGEISPQ